MDAALKPFNLDWDSADSFFFVNPRLEFGERRFLKKILREAPFLPGHCWVQSSGSTQATNESCKWIAISKQALLVSAQAVNEHLESRREDRWGVALPLFHVGALSIYARTFLSGSSLEEFHGNWEPHSFHAWLAEKKITLLSLVPTQLFDLVRAGLRAPPGLRAVIIGGARLEAKLAQQAWVLGWPVLASFGMTELGSQIATAPLGSTFSDDLRLLGHIDAKVESDGLLQIKSDALMSGSARWTARGFVWEPPVLVQGYWKTRDQAQVRARTNLKTSEIEMFLILRGRVQDFVKIKGEGVDLTQVRSRFFEWTVAQNLTLALNDYAIVDIPHERDGAALVLSVDSRSTTNWNEVLAKWNQMCFPLERMTLQFLPSLPRSAIGKVQWEKLRELLRTATTSG